MSDVAMLGPKRQPSLPVHFSRCRSMRAGSHCVAHTVVKQNCDRSYAAVGIASVLASASRLSRKRYMRRQRTSWCVVPCLVRYALPQEEDESLIESLSRRSWSLGFIGCALLLAILMFAGSHTAPAEDVVQHNSNWMLAGLQHAAEHMWPAANAAEAKDIVLDSATNYLHGADGSILVDPMSHRPIPDDWWNGLIGFQSNIIKDIDQKLRDAGLQQAFGWSIVAYTVFIKSVFYPLQKGQLRSTALMQLLSPKVKEIQEVYKDDPGSQQRLLGQLYASLDVNPTGGFLPSLLQMPLLWSLYGVWRRLAAESFPHYAESWLWVPSLAQPNPDFQYKYDWLFHFQDGHPVMGWSDYLSYLILPAILVCFNVISQQNAQAAKAESSGVKDESQGLLLKILPWISVYFIASLSLQLPQAVSLYYLVNMALSALQTQLVKLELRQEIPGYAEFEKTGKFPETVFERLSKSSELAPMSIHEAALQGNIEILERLVRAGFDINAGDTRHISPLLYAVAGGHLDAVKILLRLGADFTKKDGHGNTVFHYAAGYGHMCILEELLEVSRDVWPNDEWYAMKNSEGQAVMDAARANRKEAIVDFLTDRPSRSDAQVMQQLTTDASGEQTGSDASELAEAHAELLTAHGSESSS
eukprot:TRINITY_DN88283_c0_g1_i1.p1 TRINITY_DN88283_c0_g1~~TRINITY_DN88283_c0_g1_i1.p1  ORF type:complete len:642 (+),score=119.94 TRINITY_DN88283_c0_g1_i1:54-1979(+)